MTGLERYRDVIPEWEAFVSAISTPEPIAIRARSALIDVPTLSLRLEARGFELKDAGVEGYLRVESGPGSVAQTLEHWLGLFHIQQAVMGLPSLALAPEPGDRVLDLCAAPGGKTTHLSELMGESGPLVAVDRKEKRLRGLLGNVYRLGHSNIVVIAADGRDIPPDAGFDRVLVDAPCSGEGNVRRQGGRSAHRSQSFQRHIGQTQDALLRRGIAATRPGGSIVYSTCTFAPEENEAVVSRILADEPVEIETIELDAPHSEGLLEWDGEKYDPRMRRCWRVYPHHLDSGGLFMARMRRTDDPVRTDGPPPPPGWSPIPDTFPGADPSAARDRIASAISELEHRFGYSRDFLHSLGWMERREHLWAQTAGEWPLPAFERGSARRWRVVSVGLRALKRARGGLETPSSAFLTRWSAELPSTRRLRLSDSQLWALLEGGRIPIEADVKGPVALEWEGLVLGRGMVGADGALWHELGKSQSARLADLLRSASEGGE